ncbi:MAG: DUF2807 domain-containing protein [Flavobacteriales bacterium]|nr:DUF2807 domain-containing protein [Flavobacteriales bacterium]
MLLKGKYQILFIVFLSVGLLSCRKDSACLKGTGKIITEQRVISSDVTSIKTKDNIDIVITYSNEPSLRIEAGENLIPFINTDISDGELSLSSDNKCSMLRNYDTPIVVYVSLPNLTNIDYTGQGIITSSNTLNYSDFTFETRNGTGSINLDLNSTNVSIIQHTGPADITLTGTTNNLYAYSGRQGWQYLNNISANNVHVNNAGSGDIIVRAINNLLVELTYIGNIDYYGSPNVIVSVHTGSGELRKK